MKKEALSLGFAEESITPEGPISLAGQFYERISRYTETPITVTAMAVKSESEELILVSCDLVKVAENLVDLVRERLADLKGFDPQKLVLSATHTHTSHVYDAKGRGNFSTVATLDVLKRYVGDKKYISLTAGQNPSMNPQESLLYLADRIAVAARRAWENLHPATLRFSFGRAAVGMCRRSVYSDGSAKMWGDTNLAAFDSLESGNDSGIEIAFAVNGENQVEAVLANVACPSQVVEQRSFISSDYWGKVKKNLRSYFGDDLFVLGLCSAAGDQCPRDMIRWVNPETPIDDPNVDRPDYVPRRADPSMFDIRGTEVIGKRISREIIDAYEDLEETVPSGEMEFCHRVFTLELPFRNVTPAERDTAEKALQEFVKNAGDTFTYEENAAMHIYAGTLARWEAQHTREMVPTEIHVIRLGDTVFATNPFELFLDYGNKIRARSRATQTFLLQLTCGSFGYLPTRRAQEGSHYSAYVSSGYVGYEGGDLLVRKTVSTIRELFAE